MPYRLYTFEIIFLASAVVFEFVILMACFFNLRKKGELTTKNLIRDYIFYFFIINIPTVILMVFGFVIYSGIK